jgi:predicted nucleic acid-binding Zn ribbon protein
MNKEWEQMNKEQRNREQTNKELMNKEQMRGKPSIRRVEILTRRACPPKPWRRRVAQYFNSNL